MEIFQKSQFEEALKQSEFVTTAHITDELIHSEGSHVVQGCFYNSVSVLGIDISRQKAFHYDKGTMSNLKVFDSEHLDSWHISEKFGVVDENGDQLSQESIVEILVTYGADNINFSALKKPEQDDTDGGTKNVSYAYGDYRV